MWFHSFTRSQTESFANDVAAATGRSSSWVAEPSQKIFTEASPSLMISSEAGNVFFVFYRPRETDTEACVLQRHDVGDKGNLLTHFIHHTKDTFVLAPVHNKKHRDFLLLYDPTLAARHHRLLPPPFEQELTIGRALTLEHHAGSTDSLLVVGAGGVVAPVNPADLNVRASSATITGAVISDQLTCKGPAEMGGEVFVAGDVTVRGKVILGAGMNAGGATIANVQLEGVKFRGAVAGDVGLDGSLTIDALKTEGGGMVAVGPRGTLMTARGVTYDEDGGVLVVKKLSGHKVDRRVMWE